jgi:hypothetical protein
LRDGETAHRRHRDKIALDGRVGDAFILPSTDSIGNEPRRRAELDARSCLASDLTTAALGLTETTIQPPIPAATSSFHVQARRGHIDEPADHDVESDDDPFLRLVG